MTKKKQVHHSHGIDVNVSQVFNSVAIPMQKGSNLADSFFIFNGIECHRKQIATNYSTDLFWSRNNKS